MRDVNILIVAQAGRLATEAVLFAASLRSASPRFAGRLFVAEPQPGPLWPQDPRIQSAEIYAVLERLGAELLPFHNSVFGATYPNGNKVEALAALPDAPFWFFDSDTLITGELADLNWSNMPTASMARTATWPVPELYGPDYEGIWKSLYDLQGLDFVSSLDTTKSVDDWRRYLYFNAGWFCGAAPHQFHRDMIAAMTAIRDTPPDALICQQIYPWLDQIALPLVIHAQGGGRPGPELAALDREASWHYRSLATIFARGSDETLAFLNEITAPNWIKKALKQNAAFHRLLYRGQGDRARRTLHSKARLLSDAKLRKRLKHMGLWLR